MCCCCCCKKTGCWFASLVVTIWLELCTTYSSSCPGDDRQVATSAERRSLCGQRHTQVRPRLLVHDELHWLDVPQRVVYKLGVMVFSCLHRQAPQYLSDFCQPVSGIASRQHLRSASRQQLVVPRYRLSTYSRRAFAVAGPSVWNSLPDSLRDPAVGSDSFRRSLKTFLFATYWDMQRIWGSTRMRYTNLLLLTYLLTCHRHFHHPLCR